MVICRPYQGYPDSHRIITIPLGQTTSQIAYDLETQGVIRSSSLFRWYVRLGYAASSLKAGEYQFQNAVTLPSVVNKIQQGLVHHYKVTIREGMTVSEIGKQLEQEGFGTAELYEEEVQQTASIADLDSVAEDLEGYLFPETYLVTRSMTESEIVGAMVRNFRRMWTAERSRRAREIDLTMREVITLALLDRERNRPGQGTPAGFCSLSKSTA